MFFSFVTYYTHFSDHYKMADLLNSSNLFLQSNFFLTLIDSISQLIWLICWILYFKLFSTKQVFKLQSLHNHSCPLGNILLRQRWTTQILLRSSRMEEHKSGFPQLHCWLHILEGSSNNFQQILCLVRRWISKSRQNFQGWNCLVCLQQLLVCEGKVRILDRHPRMARY